MRNVVKMGVVVTVGFVLVWGLVCAQIGDAAQTFQGFFSLQTIVVSAYKDNKWVYVAIHETPSDPTRSVPYSLKFK